MKKERVSFDFDNTLSFKIVQKYAKELVDKGFEVHIVTSRYDAIEKYTEEAKRAFNINNLTKEFNELFEVADELGIKRKNIHFTNMEYKCGFFKSNPGFVWHLDDNVEELTLLTISKDTVPVDVFAGNWEHKCNKLLNLE